MVLRPGYTHKIIGILTFTGHLDTFKARKPNNSSNNYINPQKNKSPNRKASLSRKPASLSSVNKKDKTKTEFIIPEQPEGRLLEIKIYSNWGDKYLVGLNGIELFDTNGDIVSIEKVSEHFAHYI